MWEQWAPPSAMKSGVLFIGPGGGKSGTSWWSKCFSVVEIDWKCAQHHDYNFGLNKPTWVDSYSDGFNRQLSATTTDRSSFPKSSHGKTAEFHSVVCQEWCKEKKGKQKKKPLWTLDDSDRAMRGRWLTIIAAKSRNGSQLHLYTLYKKRQHRLATMCSNAKWPRWRLFIFLCSF